MHVLSLVLSRSSFNGNISDRGSRFWKTKNARPRTPVMRAIENTLTKSILIEMPVHHLFCSHPVVPMTISEREAAVELLIQTPVVSAEIFVFSSRSMECSVSVSVSTTLICPNQLSLDLRHHSAIAMIVTPPIITIA